MGRSSRSETYTYYEPDKVEVARINKQKEILLAKMEQKNIDKKKLAQLELMQANANFQLDIIKAKEEGFHNVTIALTKLMKEWNIITEIRIAMIDNAKFNFSRKILDMYYELQNKIEEDSFDFISNKAVKLIGQLDEIKDPDSRKMFRNQIDKFIADYINKKNELTTSYILQQEMLLQSNVDSVNSITSLTSEIQKLVMRRMDSLTQNLFANTETNQLSDSEEEILKIVDKESDTPLLENQKNN